MTVFTSLFQTKIHLSPAERSLASALEVMIIGAVLSALIATSQFLQNNSLATININELLNIMWVTFSVAIGKGATALMPQVRNTIAPLVADAISHFPSVQSSAPVAPPAPLQPTIYQQPIQTSIPPQGSSVMSPGAFYNPASAAQPLQGQYVPAVVREPQPITFPQRNWNDSQLLPTPPKG